MLLWRTTFGFRLRLLGASPAAAAYAGVSFPRCAFAVMALAGGLAGIAGGIEVLGVHYRLIEGFSLGFGFNAVAVALLARSSRQRWWRSSRRSTRRSSCGSAT